MQSRWARRVFVAARVTRADRQALNEEEPLRGTLLACPWWWKSAVIAQKKKRPTFRRALNFLRR
jgi:hypothetical protein